MKIKVAFAAVLLAGCGGGGGGIDSSCTSIGPNANYLTAGGSVDNVERAADRDFGSFATFNSIASGEYITSKGQNFSGGTKAGIFLTPPSGTTATDITVSTFVTQEQSTVESATGPTLTITPTTGDPPTEYAWFTTTAPFNGVRLTINTTNKGQFLVYEICGDGAAR